MRGQSEDFESLVARFVTEVHAQEDSDRNPLATARLEGFETVNPLG